MDLINQITYDMEQHYWLKYWRNWLLTINNDKLNYLCQNNIKEYMYEYTKLLKEHQPYLKTLYNISSNQFDDDIKEIWNEYIVLVNYFQEKIILKKQQYDFE